jgi:hypothetical protein
VCLAGGAAPLPWSASVAVAGHPKPAAVPYRWELDFTPGDLRLYIHPDDGAAYWYFTYAITNRTGREQTWAPELVLFTDDGHILRSGANVPPEVNASLLALLGNEFLEVQNEILGEIFPGKGHMKEGLVVWRAPAKDMTEMSLFISGLSGETARIRNPVTNDEVILRKTLQRDYLVPGNDAGRGSTPAELVGQRWILR